MRTATPVRLAAAALLLVIAGSSSARGSEFTYVLVFGSETIPERYQYTHTWATFVRAVGEGPDPSAYAIEAFTISWLPRTLDIRIAAVHPEPGINLPLDPTLRYVLGNREKVWLWGPFRIRPDVYRKALNQKRRLESGTVLYRAIDTDISPNVNDCIHALAGVDPIFDRCNTVLIRVGYEAGAHIARQLVEDSGFDPRADHSWLIDRFGLRRYPIDRIPPWQVDPSKIAAHFDSGPRRYRADHGRRR